MLNSSFQFGFNKIVYQQILICVQIGFRENQIKLKIYTNLAMLKNNCVSTYTYMLFEFNCKCMHKTNGVN